MPATFLLTKLIPNPVYIRVRRNQFSIRHVDSGSETTFQTDIPFLTARMPIGEFSAADHALKRALEKAERGRGHFLRMPSQILIDPLEMIDGGLS
jgi:hypothetical protein